MMRDQAAAACRKEGSSDVDQPLALACGRGGRVDSDSDDFKFRQVLTQ
jgi:hypothetical protein